MNKILRLSFIAVLAFVFNGAFADAYKTLTFPDDNSENNSVSAYTETWTATIGSDSWSITNFNNNKWSNWTYIKCGSKKAASTASIATAFAIDKAIANVTVTIDKMTASYVNSMQLIVASDADFANVVETVDAPSIDQGDIQFKPTTPTANCYYKLVFDCALAKSNGVIQISKVAYYEEGNEPVIVDITNTPETAYTVAKAGELIAAGEGLSDKVYVKGYIVSITEVSTDYGNATYLISDTKGDETTTLTVYRGYYLEGEKFSAEDQIAVGDEVIVYGQLKDYNGTNEIDSGNQLYSLNGSTTGITSISSDKLNENAPVYNLAGQRVSGNAKGLLIQNGKKFIKK